MEKNNTSSSVQTVQKKKEKEPKVINFKAKIKNNVKWDTEVVDNENMGKKKSKICWIYRPEKHGEWWSSSESDSSEDDANMYDRYPKHQKRLMKEKEQKKQDEASAENS